MRISILALWLVAGCATGSQQMVPLAAANGAGAVQRDVECGLVHVRLVEVTGDIYVFDVINLSQQPIVVDRDAVELLLPDGTRRARLPGGAATSYGIPSGGTHHVNVRYDQRGLHEGDLVRFDFSRAVHLVGGGVLPLPLLSTLDG